MYLNEQVLDEGDGGAVIHCIRGKITTSFLCDDPVN